MASNFQEALREAIYSVYTGSALETLLTGGLHYGRAPACAPGDGAEIRPYGVFKLPTLERADTFTETIHDGLLQFEFFANDIPTIETAIAECETLYDSSGTESAKWIEPDSTYCAGFMCIRENVVFPIPTSKDKFSNWKGMVDFNILPQQLTP